MTDLHEYESKFSPLQLETYDNKMNLEGFTDMFYTHPIHCWRHIKLTEPAFGPWYFHDLAQELWDQFKKEFKIAENEDGTLYRY
jgi:hypothetical protein